MIDENKKNKIIEIWNRYKNSDQIVYDTKNKIIEDIDTKRIEAIKVILGFMNSFQKGEMNILIFKTTLDSYNKRNNLWGFSATKGQMFFNQLTKSSEDNLAELTKLLKEVISIPKNIEEALKKISILEDFAKIIYSKATDKRTVPKPSSIGYFLSYFWQIQDPLKWPILYTSLITAFNEIKIWEDRKSQKETYSFFYELNETIKDIISKHSDKAISNWEIEHCFWNFQALSKTAIKTEKESTENIVEPKSELKTNFNVNDYLIPKVAKLVEIGNNTEKSGSLKGKEFEEIVSEIFKLLNFEVEVLGQGTGRNPDAIIKIREENIAFIVDAKAYTNGYNLGTDDRALKEYIHDQCPKLNKDGYKKIGFIIVSNSFKSDFDSFINDITWSTDIKRFILLSSEALLYLLAYKTKDNLSPREIVDTLITCGNLIEAKHIIDNFDDV